MTERQRDNIYYVCSLLEYIARRTHNRRKDVVKYFSKAEIQRQIELAEINHCLSFEQVSDEMIEDLGIRAGTFDAESLCQYQVPSVTSIGAVYQRLVVDTMPEDPAQGIINVFSSFISEEISDYNANTYYMNPDYLRCSYLEGRLLA